MEITAVKLRIRGEEKIKASCSITIDDCFVVHDIRIIDGSKGLYVAMPSTKFKNGDFHDIAHPINNETRDKINTAVLNEYNNQLQNSSNETTI